jgi:predicted DCC family thiol-disulfide oxidoreductase YuxK
MLFIRVSAAASRDFLFYDGHCALCHGAVKFVLKRDRSGNAFRFAPLEGTTFRSRIAPQKRAGLPDSIVVLTSEGTLLVRSAAFLHILRRLGGVWRFWAGLLAVIPRPLRDWAYDSIARIRYRVFGTRADWCPVIGPELRRRFDP